MDWIRKICGVLNANGKKHAPDLNRPSSNAFLLIVVSHRNLKKKRRKKSFLASFVFYFFTSFLSVFACYHFQNTNHVKKSCIFAFFILKKSWQAFFLRKGTGYQVTSSVWRKLCKNGKWILFVNVALLVWSFFFFLTQSLGSLFLFIFFFTFKARKKKK